MNKLLSYAVILFLLIGCGENKSSKEEKHNNVVESDKKESTLQEKKSKNHIYRNILFGFENSTDFKLFIDKVNENSDVFADINNEFGLKQKKTRFRDFTFEGKFAYLESSEYMCYMKLSKIDTVFNSIVLFDLQGKILDDIHFLFSVGNGKEISYFSNLKFNNEFGFVIDFLDDSKKVMHPIKAQVNNSIRYMIRKDSIIQLDGNG